MLFLDDFLEMLEELPAEFRERFSEMRKIDSDIEAGLDQTKKSIDEFFELGLQLPDEEKQKRFQYFQQQFARYRTMAAEKVSMAERMQEILSTYLQHLDKEKTHFKYELEADNPGVTEVIEKRFSDYVEAVVAARKERKRRHPSENGSQGGETAFKFSKNLFDSFSSLGNIPDFAGITDDDLLSPFAPMLSMPMTPTNGGSSGRGRKPNPPDSHNLSKKRPSIHSLKGTLSVPSVMNGMALSPAVSEKSWSSALNDNHSPNSSMISNPLVSSSAMPNFAGTESRHGRQRKLTSRVQEMFTEAVQRQRRTHPPIHHHEEGETERGSEDEDPDDAHKSWCICGEASYGDMICCDNENCSIQWFHYECLGMSSGSAPKGKWFCMKCQGLPFPPLPNQHQHSFDASF